MVINSGFPHEKKVIFHSYVKLPEGNYAGLLKERTSAKFCKSAVPIFTQYSTLVIQVFAQVNPKTFLCGLIPDIHHGVL